MNGRTDLRNISECETPIFNAVEGIELHQYSVTLGTTKSYQNPLAKGFESRENCTKQRKRLSKIKDFDGTFLTQNARLNGKWRGFASCLENV